MSDVDRKDLEALLTQLRADLALINAVPLPGMVKRAVINTARMIEILVRLEVARNGK